VRSTRQHRLARGLGLDDNAPLNQFVEGEYMKADEYDHYMTDTDRF
jgi:hypothetical protein